MDKKILAVIVCLFFIGEASGVPAGDFFRAITVKNCGTSILPPSSPDRIVGGTETEPGQYPWIVSLHEDGGSGFEHVCGGTVLNENWIITAAHCIVYINRPSKYVAYLGLHKQSRLNAETVQRVKISKIILHRKYDDETHRNDIALLKTATAIDIDGSNGYVNGACLPLSDEDPTGYATVAGWGHTYQDGFKSDILLDVEVPIVQREECNEDYDDGPYDGMDRVTENMICAGKNNRDACQYDSGGPLIQTDSNGVSTLIGIVSFGTGCGEKYYPGVYTKVSYFEDWIERYVSN